MSLDWREGGGGGRVSARCGAHRGGEHRPRGAHGPARGRYAGGGCVGERGTAQERTRGAGGDGGVLVPDDGEDRVHGVGDGRRRFASFLVVHVRERVDQGERGEEPEALQDSVYARMDKFKRAIRTLDAAAVRLAQGGFSAGVVVPILKISKNLMVESEGMWFIYEKCHKQAVARLVSRGDSEKDAHAQALESLGGSAIWQQGGACRGRRRRCKVLLTRPSWGHSGMPGRAVGSIGSRRALSGRSARRCSAPFGQRWQARQGARR